MRRSIMYRYLGRAFFCASIASGFVSVGCGGDSGFSEPATVAMAARVKPPDNGGDLGCLSTTDNSLNLRNGTLRNGTTVVYTFEVCTIPPDRPRLLAYVQSYWNSYPGFVLTDPFNVQYDPTG